MAVTVALKRLAMPFKCLTGVRVETAVADEYSRAGLTAGVPWFFLFTFCIFDPRAPGPVPCGWHAVCVGSARGLKTQPADFVIRAGFIPVGPDFHSGMHVHGCYQRKGRLRRVDSQRIRSTTHTHIALRGRGIRVASCTCDATGNCNVGREQNAMCCQHLQVTKKKQAAGQRQL